MSDRHTVPRVIYRYTTGRPLNGEPAPYLSSGTGRTRWGRWPGWRRQVIRLGLPAAALAGHAAYLADPVATELGATGLAALAAAKGARAGRRAWRSRRFRATYIRPVLSALGPALGDAPVQLHVDPGLGSLLPRLARPMSPAEQAARAWYGQHVEPVVRWAPERVQRAVWAVQRRARPVTRHTAKLRVPREEAGPRIELVASVPYLTPEQRQYVSAVVKSKIPAGELVEGWDMVGSRVTARWTVRRRPPAACGYADLDARMGNLKEWEFFAGLGLGGRPVTINLQDDSPHIACSAGSGAGKSVLAALIGVQVLARGGLVVILDRKGSHRWALGLPGVDYCTTPEQMHNALVRLAKLADDRNAEALIEDEGWDPGARVLVIAEELNATMTGLKDFWADVREKSDPKTSPAVKAFRNLLFMGRSAKVNVFAVAQMLTANTTGGPESRENFGVRCLARFTVNAWKMLVPEAAMPRPSRTLGRWQIVVRGVADECQVCYLTPAQARLFVHKHRAVPASPDDAGTPLMADDQELSPGHGPSGDMVDPLAELVTLRAACDRGIVPWKHPAAKKRLQRAREAGDERAPAPSGRDGQADLYRVGDLIAWAEELVS